MERMWADGESVKSISEKLDRNPSSVGCYMHAHRESFPYRLVRTSREEQEQMVALREQGWSYKRIGDYIGVNEQTVRNHIRMRSGKKGE